MKSRTVRIAMILLCTLAGACSTTYRLSRPRPDQSDTWERLELNGRTRGSYVLADQQWTRSESFSIGDSTLVVQLSGGRTTDIPLATVERVVFRNPGDGAAKGALVGLGLSFIAGVLTAGSHHHQGYTGSATTWGVAVAATIAVVTVPVGTLIGAIIGSRERFRFESTGPMPAQHPARDTGH